MYFVHRFSKNLEIDIRIDKQFCGCNTMLIILLCRWFPMNRESPRKYLSLSSKENEDCIRNLRGRIKNNNQHAATSF